MLNKDLLSYTTREFPTELSKNGFRLIPESDRDTWFGWRHNIWCR